MPVIQPPPLPNVHPSEGWTSLLRSRVAVRLPGLRNDGKFCLIEIDAPPGSGFPRHLHQREDEIFILQKGIVTVELGRDSFDAEPGSVTVLPRFVPHSWWNFSNEPARLFVIVRPAGLESLYSDERLRGIGFDDLKTLLREDFGIIVLCD